MGAHGRSPERTRGMGALPRALLAQRRAADRSGQARGFRRSPVEAAREDAAVLRPRDLGSLREPPATRRVFFELLLPTGGI